MLPPNVQALRKGSLSCQSGRRSVESHATDTISLGSTVRCVRFPSGPHWELGQGKWYPRIELTYAHSLFASFLFDVILLCMSLAHQFTDLVST